MTTSDIALPAWVGLVVVGGVCALAVWKGEWPERIAAVFLFLAWPVTLLLRDYSYAGTQWGGFAVTVFNLAVLLVIALRSDRHWPLWAAGFHLLNVITHVARALDATVGAWAYISAGILWSYLTIAALAFGVSGVMRRRRVGGAG